MPTTEQKKQYDKQYKQSEKGKQVDRLGQWKRRGLKCKDKEEYISIYNRWLNSEKCEETKCNKEYTDVNDKCMDHCHNTGLFRNIICRSCNVRRTENKNSSGITNIRKSINRIGWQYVIQIKGKTHYKSSNDLEWLKQYKIDYEEEHLYRKGKLYES